MDTSTKSQVEWGVYCENFVMIGLTADAGDNFKKRASIPLVPCMRKIRYSFLSVYISEFVSNPMQSWEENDEKPNI